MQGITFYFDWEIGLMTWLQGVAGDAGAAVAAVITAFGEELIIVALLGFVYWCYDKEMGRFLGISICIGIVLNPLLKNIVLRRRPYFDNPEIKCLKPVTRNADIYDISAQGYSFPSGHSSNSMITYGGLGVYKKKRILIVLGACLPVLVAISRMVLGVHYPTDVLTGLLMGACVLWLASFLLKRVEKRWLLYLVVFLLSCIGIFYCRTSDYYSALGIMGGFFLGDLYEESFVRFENTRVWYRCVFRIVGGFALFLGLNSLLKLPFSAAFLASATMPAFLVRLARYFIVTFVIIGLYPRVFSKRA